MTRPQVLTFLGRSAAHNEKLARLRWLKKRRRVSSRQARIVRKELNRGRGALPRWARFPPPVPLSVALESLGLAP